MHQEVLDALRAANRGHAMAYGNDPWTQKAIELFRKHLGEDVGVYLVGTGTSANIISLACAVRPYNAVICAAEAHLHLDECAAPEWHIGCKLVPVQTSNGKLTAAAIEPHLHVARGVHSASPRLVTISQCTEVGTVYTVDELKTLATFCHDRGLFLHVDGARICNAAASLDVSLAAITSEVGVDVLSFGGTKNGLAGAEAVIVINRELDVEVGRVRKQSMQLASKMRFIAAQFIALLEGDLWLRSARHANQMAAILAERICKFSEVSLAFPRQSNGVFAKMPPAWIKPLQEHTPFHVWTDDGPVVRLMTSFDTEEADIDAFITRTNQLHEAPSENPI